MYLAILVGTPNVLIAAYSDMDALMIHLMNTPHLSPDTPNDSTREGPFGLFASEIVILLSARWATISCINDNNTNEQVYRITTHRIAGRHGCKSLARDH